MKERKKEKPGKWFAEEEAQTPSLDDLVLRVGIDRFGNHTYVAARELMNWAKLLVLRSCMLKYDYVLFTYVSVVNFHGAALKLIRG